MLWPDGGNAVIRRVWAMGLVVATIGCSQDPSLRADLSNARTGASPAVVVAGSHLSPGALYRVGVFTIWSPEFVGVVHANPAGNVASQMFGFGCSYIVSYPITVGLYREDGVAVAQTAIYAAPCRP
jgi:hypothetical protein